MTVMEVDIAMLLFLVMTVLILLHGLIMLKILNMSQNGIISYGAYLMQVNYGTH